MESNPFINNYNNISQIPYPNHNSFVQYNNYQPMNQFVNPITNNQNGFTTVNKAPNSIPNNQNGFPNMVMIPNPNQNNLNYHYYNNLNNINSYNTNSLINQNCQNMPLNCPNNPNNQNYQNFVQNNGVINEPNHQNINNNTNHQVKENAQNVENKKKYADFETPTGDENNLNKKEKEELVDYYEDLKEEEKEDKEIIYKLDKKSTITYLNNDNSFSYNAFKKAPTTYIDNNKDYINLTYMSCVLQCLANIAPIAKFYLRKKKYFAKNMDKCVLNYAFSRFISNMYSYPQEEDKQFYQTFKIDEFRQLIIKNNKTFIGNSTKDASQFLHYLIGMLEEEQDQLLRKENNNINKKINYNNPLEFKKYYDDLIKEHNSIFFNCFNWIHKKEIICKNDHRTIEFNNYLTYVLDIEKYINDLYVNNQQKNNSINEIHITNCIEKELDDINLYNIYCDSCKQKINKNQTRSIYISPNYFIFLTDFRKNRIISEKFDFKSNQNSDKFIFKIDEEINLSKKIENKNSYMNYSLEGIISYNFEEKLDKYIYYVAYYKSSIDNFWYKYTSGAFEKINLPKVLNSFVESYLLPCILIYKHK